MHTCVHVHVYVCECVCAGGSGLKARAGWSFEQRLCQTDHLELEGKRGDVPFPEKFGAGGSSPGTGG